MTTRPTLASLKEEAANDLAEWLEDEHTEDETKDRIHEIASSVVPAMTTMLFQMVVDDNSLAFLDVDHADTPFEALSHALHDEIVGHLFGIHEEAR
jgi:hypothetical protein